MRTLTQSVGTWDGPRPALSRVYSDGGTLVSTTVAVLADPAIAHSTLAEQMQSLDNVAGLYADADATAERRAFGLVRLTCGGCGRPVLAATGSKQERCWQCGGAL